MGICLGSAFNASNFILSSEDCLKPHLSPGLDLGSKVGLDLGEGLG